MPASVTNGRMSVTSRRPSATCARRYATGSPRTARRTPTRTGARPAQTARPQPAIVETPLRTEREPRTIATWLVATTSSVATACPRRVVQCRSWRRAPCVRPATHGVLDEGARRAVPIRPPAGATRPRPGRATALQRGCRLATARSPRPSRPRYRRDAAGSWREGSADRRGVVKCASVTRAVCAGRATSRRPRAPRGRAGDGVRT